MLVFIFIATTISIILHHRYHTKLKYEEPSKNEIDELNNIIKFIFSTFRIISISNIYFFDYNNDLFIKHI
jgi:hypothetical protein